MKTTKEIVREVIIKDWEIKPINQKWYTEEEIKKAIKKTRKNRYKKLDELDYLEEELFKKGGEMKLNLLFPVSDILEYFNDGTTYDFYIIGKGTDEEVIKLINEELEDDYLQVDKLKKIGEMAYTTSRFYEGEDAKDENCKCFVNLVDIKDYKKGLGKCKFYTVTLIKTMED